MIQETSFNLQTEINTNQDKVPDNCEFYNAQPYTYPKATVSKRILKPLGAVKKKNSTGKW